MRTMNTLRLDFDAAMAGKIWLLLPEGFRHADAGKTYPLPNRLVDLQRLSAIPIPPRNASSGAYYIRRAVAALRAANRTRQSAVLDAAQRQYLTKVHYDHFREKVKKLSGEATKDVNRVREKAEECIASLTDLFDLGRRGLDGQMRAHLDGQKWQGEDIDAKAFRDCFRMVSQAVKGLGLPSDQRAVASDAILREVAASMEATQDAIALAPGPDPEAKPS